MSWVLGMAGCRNSYNIKEKMRKRQFYWLIILSFLAILLAGLLFLWQKETAEEPLALKTDVYQEITGFSFSEYISGKKKMEIKAEKASIRPKRIGFLTTSLVKETYLVKPQLLFFADGEKISHIAADSGRMDMATKKIILKKNVSLLTASGKTLSAEEMTVEPDKEMLSISGSYALEINGKIIEGKKLKTDVELRDINI